MKISLGKLAEEINGELSGDPEIMVDAIAGIEEAKPGSLVYVASLKKLKEALLLPGAAILAPLPLQKCERPVIAVKNPKLAFAKILSIFHPSLPWEPGIHPTAVIDKTAQLGEKIHVGPCVVIGKGARIGNRVFLSPFVFVGDEVSIEEDSLIHPHASLLERVRIGKRCVIYEGVVIGSQGFGYATDDSGKHFHVPQNGIVVLEDDVEIGANSTVDRAALGETRIGRGTKIDNLVHVAHNCRIGENCLIAASTGIAGSVTIGSGTVIGGQGGVADHVHIGEKCVVAAGAKVWGDLSPGSFVSGEPARPHKKNLHIQAALQRLPDIVNVINRLEKEKKPEKKNK